MRKFIAAMMAVAMLGTSPVITAEAKIPVVKLMKETDSATFWNKLSARKGKYIYVTYVTGVMTNLKGDGRLDGFRKKFGYISYRGLKNVHKGDRILSVFVYNPDTGYTDDIVERCDFVVECKRH